MSKIFAFEIYATGKSYGSRQRPEGILMVKGAADKDAAKQIAERNYPSKRFFSGKSFPNEAKAVEWSNWSANLFEIPLTVIDADMQRSVAKLLGM